MGTLPKLFLDTNVLRNKDFIHWVSANYTGRVAISSIAYMEYKRQLLKNHKKPSDFEMLLRKYNISIESFNKKEADYAASLMNQRTNVCKTCNKIDWADTMIYASIGENASSFIVTENISDYPNDKRVKTPVEIERLFKPKK